MMDRVTDPELIKQLDEARLSQSKDNRKPVTDPDLIKKLDEQRLKKESSNQGTNLFKINDPNATVRMANEMYENPKQTGKDLIQAIGLVGSAAVPELSLMKGATMLPNAVNALTRSGIGGTFGAMANPENPLEGGALGAAIPPIARVFTKTLPALINKTTPEIVGKYLQEGYGKLKGKAEGLFDTVRNEANSRGINILPIDPSFIRKLSSYLPKTDATKDLLKKAESGDYESLRKVQTDLFNRGTKNWKTQADMDRAARGMEKRDELNTFIHDYFKNTGHPDLANSLSEARTLYRELQDTYHTKKLPKSIRDIYDSDLLQISPKILETLSKDSKPLNKLIKSNPLVAKELEKIVPHQNALKSLKRLGIGSILGTSTLGALDIVDLAKNILSPK